jgi:hypothetical protein
MTLRHQSESVELQTKAERRYFEPSLAFRLSVACSVGFRAVNP